jgi:uncharacterized protein YigA (DUF484 family)
MARAAQPNRMLTPEDVVTFLRANPRFLADHPDLYRLLAPPQRVHGDTMADHMAAMLAAERTHAARMTERADGVLAAGRASAGLAARVHEAVLALIGIDSPADCIAAAFPALLAVDAATLCIEAPVQGARQVPEGTVATALGNRAVIFRQGTEADSTLLHGEAARLALHDALVRVPGEGPDALIALVARDPHALDPAQGTGALLFLGRAVAAALGR